MFASSPDCRQLIVTDPCVAHPGAFIVCREGRGVDCLGPSCSVSIPVLLFASLWTSTDQDGHAESRPTSPQHHGTDIAESGLILHPGQPLSQ